MKPLVDDRVVMASYRLDGPGRHREIKVVTAGGGLPLQALRRFSGVLLDADLADAASSSLTLRT